MQPQIALVDITGADFSATIQLFGLTAGAVEGRQIFAKWELGDGAQQRLAAGETRTLRLATITQIAPGVRAWAVHRADGDDIRGVDLVELTELRLVANPDLIDPCHLQILLNADGGSRMARVGVDPPLFHAVPSLECDGSVLSIAASSRARGSETMNSLSLPRPPMSADTLPPCRSTRCLTIVSPRR